MNLMIQAPIKYQKEIEYTASFIFSNFNANIEYQFEEQNKKIIFVFESLSIETTADFFENYYKPRKRFETEISKLSLIELGIVGTIDEDFLPILFGKNFVEKSDCNISLHFDFIGTIFYFLSGFDEMFIERRDNHGRISAYDTINFKRGLIERPLVDEYIFFLVQIIKNDVKDFNYESSYGKVLYTCDVDYPFDDSVFRIRRLAIQLFKDLFIRCNLFLFVKRILNQVFYYFNIHIFDPYYTFKKIVQICNKYKCEMHFFFITDNYGDDLNGVYSLDFKIAKLIRELINNGANIGVHGSYNSFNSLEKILGEKNKLNDFFLNHGIDCSVSSIRQHYLQINYFQSLPLFVMAKYRYDFTGGYADYPGFRFGTSKSFFMWDNKNICATSLIQRPLILMEATLFAKRYLAFDYSSDVLKFVMKLKKNCLKYGGDFIFLWHNSHFNSKKDFSFFEKVISE